MDSRVAASTLAAASAAALAGCGDMARLPVEAGMGPNPALPAPSQVAHSHGERRARGELAGGHEAATAPGTTVTAFATGLEHPRWLYVLPNGDVLVAETNAPPKPEDGKGIKGCFMKKAMKKAGAAVAEPEPHHAAARCATAMASPRRARCSSRA